VTATLYPFYASLVVDPVAWCLAHGVDSADIETSIRGAVREALICALGDCAEDTFGADPITVEPIGRGGCELGTVDLPRDGARSPAPAPAPRALPEWRAPRPAPG
jgi:hypothetical protein